MRRWSIVAVIGLYPFLVYAALQWLDVRWLALLTLLFFLHRCLLWPRSNQSKSGCAVAIQLDLPKKRAIGLGILAALPLLLLLSAFFGSERLFFLTPALLNFSVFLLFFFTLATPPSLAERVALVRRKELTIEQSRYCRKVTIVWTALLFFNSCASLLTALFCDLRIWTLFNGLIVYVLIGTLFLAEVCYRYYRFRVYDGEFLDRFFRPIFPPPN